MVVRLQGMADTEALYAVASKGTLSEGKQYIVRNERKGTFTMLVTKIDGEWITGTITDGVAKAIVRDNVRDVGEEITVRACHSYFIPAGKTPKPRGNKS